MTHYMPLSRAARLVGVSRNTLQKKIRAGDLSTFEGQVAIEELLRVYPQTQLEDSTLLERAQHIMDYALTKPSGQSLQMPDVDTLITRISRVSSELAQTKALLRYQTNLLQSIQQQLEKLSNTPDSSSDSSRFTAFQHWFEIALQQRPTFADRGNPLAVKNTLLQIIAAEVTFWPSGHEFLQEGADTLLEAALQAGYNPIYGCHDGRCGRCKARLLAGQAKPVRHLQTPLPDPIPNPETDGHWIYLCRHTAVTHVTLELQEIQHPQDIPEQHLVAQCDAIQRLSNQMLLVNLSSTTPQRLQYLAGQAVTLNLNTRAKPTEMIAMVADLASCPCEERMLQFHIPANSSFGQALQQTPQTPILVHNPHGEFVLNTTQLRPLLFIAYENGFTPIKSLIQHALALDIAETIDLYWITCAGDGHYEDNVCRAWHDALDNFNYIPLIGAATDSECLTPIIQQHPNLADYTLYLAGSALDIQLTQEWLNTVTTAPLTLYTKQINH